MIIYTSVPQIMIIWGMVPEISSPATPLTTPLTTPNNPENQNFEKMRKTPGGIIILNMSNINENHMIYDSWDMKCNRQTFFVILGYFLPFYPHNSPINENFQKMKKRIEISSFYTSVPKTMIIYYTVPEIWRVADVIAIFDFGLFFALLPL